MVPGSLLNSSHAIVPPVWNPPILLFLIQPVCLMKTLVGLIVSEILGAAVACAQLFSSTGDLA